MFQTTFKFQIWNCTGQSNKQILTRKSQAKRDTQTYVTVEHLSYVIHKEVVEELPVGIIWGYRVEWGIYYRIPFLALFIDRYCVSEIYSRIMYGTVESLHIRNHFLRKGNTQFLRKQWTKE